MARIAGINIPQNKLVQVGLTYIYGIGDKFSKQICRSLEQAKNLATILESSNQKIDYIFFLNVQKEVIIKRVEKRKTLEKRSDDDSNIILKRYDTYMDMTRPVLDFYSKNSNFYEIDGALKIEQITAKIDAFLNV